MNTDDENVKFIYHMKPIQWKMIVFSFILGSCAMFTAFSVLLAVHFRHHVALCVPAPDGMSWNANVKP